MLLICDIVERKSLHMVIVLILEVGEAKYFSKSSLEVEC